MDMFPITWKGSSYFVSGNEKDISFVVSTNKRLYISNFGTRGDCRWFGSLVKITSSVYNWSMDFGKSFRFYRQKAGLTQKKAAELIGIKDYQLGNYETNRSQPSLELLKKMSKVYMVSIDKMLGNNMLANKYPNEADENTYFDMDELLKNLNDTVAKMNKANKK